ncbi:RES family NAD+ phosphorylase [Sphaerisporangium corydalis]|uniref:RES family NAD+ phosphorylase n=1 Tax=Sphaerisporangium corydalis TaxID=1441875 RepID=A0ABV9EGN3_9ACTN|nr:RES family NAD+ phosphorylase [Sphaerisporangium corydalis]
MPGTVPPPRYAGQPNRTVLPPGTRLWRVHYRSVAPDAFTRPRAEAFFGGGRFDGTAAGDPYDFYYAGLDASTALAEVFLRDLTFGADGMRVLPHATVAHRRASLLRTVAPLRLISLVTGPDLAAVAQDDWLVHADAHEYPKTRRWAQWMRGQAPWAQGLVWSSKRDAGKKALVLFGDRLAGGALSASPAAFVDLDAPAGTAWVNATLAPYRTVVASPRVARRPVARTRAGARRRRGTACRVIRDQA